MLVLTRVIKYWEIRNVVPMISSHHLPASPSVTCSQKNELFLEDCVWPYEHIVGIKSICFFSFFSSFHRLLFVGVGVKDQVKHCNVFPLVYSFLICTLILNWHFTLAPHITNQWIKSKKYTLQAFLYNYVLIRLTYIYIYICIFIYI